MATCPSSLDISSLYSGSITGSGTATRITPTCVFLPGIDFEMRSSGFLRGIAYFLLFNVSKAAPSSNKVRHVGSAHPVVERAATCHTSTNRACWSDGFDINTDYEEHFPATGIVREVCIPAMPLSGIGNLC